MNRGNRNPKLEECRHCGCSFMRGCQIYTMVLAIAPNDSGLATFHNKVERCRWADATKRCCTNPACLEKEAKRRKGQ